MLDALGNIGDFVGGIGVVITLAYLAIQVHSNTSALRVRSRQDISDGFRTFLSPLVHDPEACNLFLEGMQGYYDLPQPKRMQYGALMTDQVFAFQNAFALHEAGTLEEEIYASHRDFLCACLATPGGSEFWADVRVVYWPRLVKSIDERIAAGGIPDLSAQTAFFRRD
jgi:hypothetical protein